MSASLAYYTAFSLAPLIVLAIAMVGFIFGHSAAEGKVVSILTELIGAQQAKAVESLLRGAHAPSAGILAGIIGVVTLLVGASSVMTDLKDSLNRIWRVQDADGIGSAIKSKALSYAMVLIVGSSLLVSLLISTLLPAAGKFLAGGLPMPEFVLQTMNLMVSVVVITVLFALIYKILPDIEIPWRDVWLGSAVTALLFSIGKWLIGVYLGKAGVASSYGAAGSILAMLAWVYYSAMIIYLGAEFTKVYSDKYGSHRGV